VYVDLKQVESGSLYDDFDMLPPKTIKVRSCGGVLSCASCWYWCAVGLQLMLRSVASG
jgi:hypothetical protein